MFKSLKIALQKRYDELSKNQSTIFYKDIDRDKVWEVYLNSFDESIRQEYNCNSCKSFLRQYSGIVFIKDNQVKSIWDLDLDLMGSEYEKAIRNIKEYIQSLSITNIFLSETKKLGNSQNFDKLSNVIWEHLSLNAENLRTTNIDDIATLKGKTRTNKEVLKRALDELTTYSLEAVLEMIAQKSLYRGTEFEIMVTKFLKLKKEYDTLPVEQKDAFTWSKSTTLEPYVVDIRNSVIGTLLVELSEGVDLDTAVRKYEVKVAPSNYKRPTALITPRMIEDAKNKLTELGFLESINRRFASSTDVSINNLLFIDRSSELNDIFKELQKEALINPKTLSKVEEVSIKDFIEKILPTAKSIEVLLEQNNFSNLVSLITAEEKESPTMFKWNNPFSWSYAGGIADSMKERVKNAGGNIDGVLRYSIQWNDEETKARVDFDAHAHEPNGEHIFYSSSFRRDRGNKRTHMSGQLDVDMISPEDIGVENITWTDLSKMKSGNYKFGIHNFSRSPNKGFKAQIEFNGEIYDFYYPKHVESTIDVAVVSLKNGVFSISSDLKVGSNLVSKERWGVKTNQFTKVKSIMLSPNYWDENKTGNKHYLFMLEGCINDEEVRPFYNEFLKQELNENRKVFEVMGSKLKVPKATNQLSGIGFSETQTNSLIVQVTGSFKRNIKIKF